MIVSGDERDAHDDFYEDALNYIKHIDSGYSTKFGGDNDIHITQAESTENESVSSNSSHGDEADTEDNLLIISEDSNMDFLDEPDSDYSDGNCLDESEHELAEWSDAVIEDDDSVDLDRGSTNSDMNDEEMSDPDIMDALTDYSEQDGDDEDEDEDDAGPQVTIAIEVDHDNSDNSVEIMSSDGEDEEDDEPAVEFDPDSDIDEPNTIDDRIVVHYDNDDFFDTSSDFEENSQISQFSTPSSSRSRSRSPIVESNQSNSRPVGNNVPPVLTLPVLPLPDLEPSAPAAADIESTKPSSSKSPTDETVSEDLGGDGLCCICLDSASNHVVVPCGHICLCQQCKEVYESNDNHRRKKKCPLCKTPFTIIIKVYK